MIIDAHVHLNERHDGTALGAAMELDRQVTEAGIDQVVVLHLQAQGWSAQEFAEAVAPYPRLRPFVNIHPHQNKATEDLREAVEQLGYVGLKLHPRLQEFRVDDVETERLVQFAGELHVPVLIDAFPDGTHLMQGFDPVRYANLAKRCPNTRIIWAHMGGHRVIDFMMLAKRLPNVYMDFSYSLLYFRTSSVPKDMVYAMRSMQFNRVFFGSDYPDRPLQDSLDLSREQLLALGVSSDELKKIMGLNAAIFFGWGQG